MATLDQLQADLENLQSGYKEAKARLQEVTEDYNAGLLDLRQYQAMADEHQAIMREKEQAIQKVQDAIQALQEAAQTSDEAQQQADETQEETTSSTTRTSTGDPNAALAATLYNQAETLYKQWTLGQISTSRLELELDIINAELKSIDWSTWSPPKPIVEPEPPAPAAAGEIDLGPLQELLGSQGELKDLAFSPGFAKQLQDTIEQALLLEGVTDELMDSARESPINPEKAAELAKALTLGILGGVGLAGSAVILAEAGSLGQLETPARIMQMMFGASGMDKLASDLAMIPFQTGIIRGTERHWNAINQAEIPGSSDLTRMLVRETITRETYDQAMREQGFQQQWTDAYWISHWREMGRRDVQDAFHRGVITRVERDKLLVILDYRPDNRPGLSKSDLEIVASIGKTLIPRVDLRRAYKLGVIDYDMMVKAYTDLGYEEDAELMAYIQSNTGFESAQNAVIRTAGRMFSYGMIDEQGFRQTYDLARETQDDWLLWLYRYTLERQIKLGDQDEDEPGAEEIIEESTEINENQGGGDDVNT